MKKICSVCGEDITGDSCVNGLSCYHVHCFLSKVAPTCCFCELPIGRESFYHDDWKHAAHSYHKDVMRWCQSCGRIYADDDMPHEKLWRSLCPPCAKTVVDDEDKLRDCLVRDLETLKAVGIVGIPSTIPIYIKPKHDMTHCLGKCYLSIHRESNHIDCHIDMVEGLSELEFRGVLAHELFHYWIAKFARKTTPQEEEGFCNLGKALIYTRERSIHGDYLLWRMYKNDDKIYGDGYRLQKMRLEKMDWSELLNSLYKK